MLRAAIYFNALKQVAFNKCPCGAFDYAPGDPYRNNICCGADMSIVKQFIKSALNSRIR
jgi:hypothetical protein